MSIRGYIIFINMIKLKDLLTEGNIEKLMIPKTTFDDKEGKEFAYQGGKFLIYTYPDKRGAWTKRGQTYRKTAKHTTTLIKLDDRETEIDRILQREFHPTQQDPETSEYYLKELEGRPSKTEKGNINIFKDRIFNGIMNLYGIDKAREIISSN